jgi:hypothetical protein
MFENANRIAPWIIATGIWANFGLALYGGAEARAFNVEFTKALHSVAAIKTDMKALEADLSSFRYLACVRSRICPR